MKFLYTTGLSLFFGFILSFSLQAQVRPPLELALEHIQQHRADWGLTAQDVTDMHLSQQLTSKHNGVTHLYFVQRHQGIEVHNAILNVNILPDGRVLSVGKRFIPSLAEKVNAAAPVLTPGEAVLEAAAAIGAMPALPPRMLEKIDDLTYRYEGGTISREPMRVQLRYLLLPDQSVRLVWDLNIDPFDARAYWDFRVDALSGQVLEQMNRLLSCSFGDMPYRHEDDCREENALSQKASIPTLPLITDGAVYNVFPLPVESPSHGDRQLLDSPADPIASPFGWHDTDGSDGAEYTITRGNNAYAFYDGDANQMPSVDTDGGPTLNFDFPYDPALEPNDMKDAAVTNLFYLSNAMHDFLYHYGFDEDAGNYQANHYGQGPGDGDNDVVNALASYGGEDPEGFDELNNADFLPTSDGNNGRMRMFHWNTGNTLLEVTAPAAVAGLYNTGLAEFGPSPLDVTVSGEVVVVDDEVLTPYTSDGCQLPFANDLTGKIAMVDRGGCVFELKAKNAEEAGAIAVIICNFDDQANDMAGNAGVEEPNIPTVSLSVSSCALIRQYAGSGLTVTMGVPEDSGPTWRTGDFDNGIIAHEYAHGLSTRLTGGRFNSGCLSGPEQMGEGWSDFFALVATAKPGDTGDMRRGMGTYVLRTPTDGKGYRPYPYSTDLDVNPLTYGDIVSLSVPHGVGSAWCSMLWDLYWAFVDEYGWDPDLYTGTGGNNMAIQLVIDAMKMQPCEPGFEDGRDAILAADEALFGGANQCLIWEVFARRGLGYYASQGFFFSTADGTEDFEPLPTCVPELKIKKTASDFIEAGDEIQYTLTVVNHKPETLTNVVVTDDLPNGLTYVAGSGSIEPVVDGSQLTFELGDLPFDQEVVITYEAKSVETLHSTRFFFDDVETTTAGLWATYPIGDEDSNEWILSDLFAYSGNQSFFVEDISTESQQALQLLVPQPAEGDRPALRFYHRYDTQAGVDGGFVELSTDFGATWIRAEPEDFIRNGYTGPIAYGTFIIPNTSAFWGNSNGWKATYLDLSAYAGQEVQVRFRFGTNNSSGGFGWFVDDIEFMDLFSYNSEACVTSDEGDLACASAAGPGTIVESQLPSSTIELGAGEQGELRIFPNPADDLIYLALDASRELPVSIQLFTADGRLLIEQETTLLPNQALPIDIADLPKGIYFVQVTTATDRVSAKVVVE